VGDVRRTERDDSFRHRALDLRRCLAGGLPARIHVDNDVAVGAIEFLLLRHPDVLEVLEHGACLLSRHPRGARDRGEAETGFAEDAHQHLTRVGRDVLASRVCTIGNRDAGRGCGRPSGIEFGRDLRFPLRSVAALRRHLTRDIADERLEPNRRPDRMPREDRAGVVEPGNEAVAMRRSPNRILHHSPAIRLARVVAQASSVVCTGNERRIERGCIRLPLDVGRAGHDRISRDEEPRPVDVLVAKR
jgi:hypothetical protein